MAGYSGTPLPKKLGIKDNFQVVILGAPQGYQESLDPLPVGVTFRKAISGSTDLVHLFTTSRDVLLDRLVQFREKTKPDCIIWISWPKKASKMPTEVTEDTIRELCLPLGFVDIKVCAVDEVWSGLKLMVRKELRGKA